MPAIAEAARIRKVLQSSSQFSPDWNSPIRLFVHQLWSGSFIQGTLNHVCRCIAYTLHLMTIWYESSLALQLQHILAYISLLYLVYLILNKHNELFVNSIQIETL